MPLRLDSQSADFEAQFRDFLAVKREASHDVEQTVRGIIADVKARGDSALAEFTAKFDRVDLAKIGLRVTAAEIDEAQGQCKPEALAALKLARDRIEAYHVRQKPKDDGFTDALGVEMGSRWTAIQAVGLYVPGGTAAYPSSVLMNAVPAKVAGCERLVMVVPAPDGKLEPLVLAAAKLAGVDEIYRVGGAQAIAALAYGTKSIAPVAKIVGPGHAYVAAAKRLVFGQVGIDMIAGPSEVLILADKTGNADWIAADLLAQAEHDASAQSILITDDVGAGHAGRGGGRLTDQDAAARRDRRRVVARLRRHHHRCPSWTMRLRWSIGWRLNIWKSLPTMPKRWCRRSAMPARSSSARIRRKRSAITSGGRTMFCPPLVRRGSRRASACSISMKRTSILLKCRGSRAKLRALGPCRDRRSAKPKAPRRLTRARWRSASI